MIILSFTLTLVTLFGLPALLVLSACMAASEEHTNPSSSLHEAVATLPR